MFSLANEFFAFWQVHHIAVPEDKTKAIEMLRYIKLFESQLLMVECLARIAIERVGEFFVIEQRANRFFISVGQHEHQAN